MKHSWTEITTIQTRCGQCENTFYELLEVGYLKECPHCQANLCQVSTDVIKEEKQYVLVDHQTGEFRTMTAEEIQEVRKNE